MGIHGGSLTRATLIKLWKTFLFPNATYVVQLTREKTDMESRWEALEKIMLPSTIGCYSKRHKNQLLDIAKMPTVTQQREIAMTVLERRGRR